MQVELIESNFWHGAEL